MSSVMSKSLDTLGGGKSLTEKTSVYGELYGATNNDDFDVSGKAGLRYTF